MILSGGYPESWDDESETYEEIVCDECKKDSKHKLDYTFSSRKGYEVHLERKHPKEEKKRTKKDIRAAGKIASIKAAVDAAAKKRNQDSDFTEVLTQSIDNVSMRNQVSEPVIEKENDMAAKKKAAKKTVSKKTAAKRAPSENKLQTAEAIGRERKLLLRLSNDEYNALQAKAAKQNVSMAMLLRSVI